MSHERQRLTWSTRLHGVVQRTHRGRSAELLVGVTDRLQRAGLTYGLLEEHQVAPNLVDELSPLETLEQVRTNTAQDHFDALRTNRRHRVYQLMQSNRVRVVQ